MLADTSAPATSWRRFWITVLCFAVANAGVWLVYARFYGPRRDLLRVDNFSPGEKVTVAARPTLLWRFNIDVMPAGTKDADASLKRRGPTTSPAEQAPGVIHPAVRGKWTWLDTRTLTFTPTEDLPKATQFTLTIPRDRLETVDGYRLARSWETTLNTAPLTVRGVRQVEFDQRRNYVIEIEFDDKVVPADVLKHLKIKGPDGQALPCELHGEAAGRIVRVRADASSIPDKLEEEDAGELNLDVELSAGLAGQSGPLGLPQAVSTTLKVDSVLMATGVEAYAPTHGPVGLSIRFNNRIDLPEMKEVLSVEPAVPFEAIRQYPGVVLQGDFQPGTRYAVKIAKAPKGTDPRKYPRPDTLSVFVPDREAGVWFEHPSGYLGSAGNRTILAHAINTPDLRVTVARVYDNNLVAWQNVENGGHYYTGGGSGADGFGRVIAEKTVKLVRDKNKPQDVRISLDELLPADDPHDGVYRLGLHTDDGSVFASDEEDEVRQAKYGRQTNYSEAVLATLSDIGLSARSANDGLLVWAVSLSTAKPLGGVRVRVYSTKNQLLGESKTNADGLATIGPINPPPGEKASVVIAEAGGGQQAASGQELAASRPLPAASSPSRGLTWLKLDGPGTDLSASTDTGGLPYLRTGYEAYVYTERGVYRPGETVHLRAIVRGAHGIVPPSFPVRWQIRRPDMRDWKGEVVQLDADGGAGLDLQLPADLPTGRWSAHLGMVGESGKAGKFFGQTDFQVEEFMPDRMKVAVKIDKPQERVSAATSKPVIVNVQGDYLFGQPAAEREATLVANLSPTSFSAKQFAGWTFGDSAGTSAVLEGMRAVGQRIEAPNQNLDKSGHAKFELRLPIGKDAAVAPAANTLNSAAQDEQDQDAPVVRPAPEATPGSATLQVTPAPAKAPYLGPWRLDANGSVLEVGGRAVSGFDSVDVDYLPYYVGVHAFQPTTARPGVPFSFEVGLVKPSGQIEARSARLTATLYRDTWNNSLVFSEGRYHYASHRVLEVCKSGCPDTVALEGGRGVCSITVADGGQYVLRLTDPVTGAVTSTQFFASRYGGGWSDSISRENPESLEIRILPPGEIKPAPINWSAVLARPWNAWGAHRLAPDPDEAPLAGKEKAPHQFRVGQQAQVVVRSPFAGQLLLTVETDKVLSTRVIDMPAGSVAVPIDVTEACRPNAYVTAAVIRAIDPNAKWRVHRAYGAAPLLVNNVDRRLKVQIDAPQEMRPSGTLQVAVRVSDEAGRPMPGAAVTLAAVDEGICQLTGFQTPDPFDLFHRRRALGVRSADIYSLLMPEVAKPDKLSSVGGDSGGQDMGRHRSVVQARRVRPVSLVTQVVHTDADGVAHGDFAVPQFSGQLRVMAVAYCGPTYGNGEKPVLVRSPVLAQSSWPRFAAPGDQFTVPVTVFNNTPTDGAAQVTLQLPAGDPLAFTKTLERSLTLPSVNVKAGGQATVSFEMTAGQSIGVAHAQLTAAINGESFQEPMELPVRPASPIVSRGDFALAMVDAPAKVLVPADMIEGTQKIEVRISPRPILQLPEGLDYLERYPYGCLEQTTSTAFPLVYLADIGPRIAPGLFAKERVAKKVQVGITRLIGMQTASGGLAMWPGGHQEWVWGSVYAAHFVVEAQLAGHEVPQEFRDHLLTYVRSLLNEAGDDGELLETQAYACYVLALAGKPERPAMSRLAELARSQALPVFPTGRYVPIHEQRMQARLFLSAAWMMAGRRDLAAGLIPQTIPQPRPNRELGGNVGSPIRDRAVLINTLLLVQPDHPALPALVQALADAGRQGRWCSTQDVAFSLLALGRYLRQTKDETPFDSAELWAAGMKLASADGGLPLVWEGAQVPVVDGATTAPASQPTSRPVELRITGPAASKGYVAWLQTGVPVRPPADADNGLEIRRRYLDDHGQPLNLLAVHSGQLVQVELTIKASIATENVVIEDLLPAGLEVENPRFQTSARADQQVTQRRHRRSDPPEPGYFSASRVEMMDDRLVLMGSLSGNGAVHYTYLARAVTPGTFIVPPVRGECMYDFSTNSIWGGGGKLRIWPTDRSSIAHVE